MMPRAPRSHFDKPYDRPRASDDKWVHDKAPADVPRAVTRAVTRASPGAHGPLSSRLVVSNLHYDVTAKDLISIFGRVGTLVREPDIKYDRSGRSTGVAILQFETPAEATAAKNKFNGLSAKDQPMEIAFDARPSKKNNDSKSLLNRISKPPLIERLDSEALPTAPRANKTEPGPNGGPVRTRGGRGKAGGRPKKEPKTAEDLDKELETFMADDSSKPVESASAPAPTVGDADVEMAT